MKPPLAFHRVLTQSQPTLPLLLACMWLISGMPAWAQPSFRGPYLRAAGGATLVDDVTAEEFYGPLPGGTMKLDAGPRFDVAVGYAFNRYLAVEVETGWSFNEVDSIQGLGIRDGSLSSLPLLANVVLQYPLLDSRLIPYAGGGVGGNVGVVDFDLITDGFTSITGNDSDLAFAYQGFAGLQYRFNDRMAVGVAYKYLGFEDTTYYKNLGGSFGPTGQFHLGAAHTHSFSATFNYRF